MREYRYKGHRFKQPFRFIFSLIYTIIYPFKHRRLKRPIRVTLKLSFSICLMIMLVPALAISLIPTPVKADDDAITKEMLKLEGKDWTDSKELKKQVIIQKSNTNDIPIESVNVKDSVVAVTYPAPVIRPTIENVTFKAKIVEKSEDKDKTGIEGTKSNAVSSSAETIDNVSNDTENASNKQKTVDTANNSTTVEPTTETIELKNIPTENTASTASPDSNQAQNNVSSLNLDDDEIMPSSSETAVESTPVTTDTSTSANLTDEISDLNLGDKNVSIVNSDEKSENDSSDTHSVDNIIFQEEQAAAQNTDKPTLIIKSDQVTVNKNDVFNPESFIAYIDTPNHSLRVLQTDSNVDTSKDGNYTCTYKVIDQSGNTDTKTLKVTVATHPEQAAEEKKAEEAKKAAEEKAEHQENLKEVRDAGGLFTEERENKKTGPSYNPYPGWNYNNCTWAAWQLAHDNLGVNLPHWGNASLWLKKAQADGYATGSVPKKGAIQVSGGGAGHVSYVADVSSDGKSVYIQQGSFYADNRKIPYSGGYSELWQNAYGHLQSGKPILGYIYLE